MFDKNTLNFLKNIEARCRNEAFYRNYKDICIATKIALSNIKGSGVKLRTTLVRLADPSDKIVASKVLNFLKREVGSITDSERLKLAAARYVYKKVLGLI